MASEVDRYVPHRGRMSLLDEVLDHTVDQCTARVTVTPRSTFYLPASGVPAYVGLEYMAQTVAAYDGTARTGEGGTPVIGFLLGTRHYRCDRDRFADGETLIVTARRVVIQPPVASFDCTIAIGGEVVATASLTVYRSEGNNLEFPGE